MAQERPVLHQPKHGVSPWFLLMASERAQRGRLYVIASARRHRQHRRPLGGRAPQGYRHAAAVQLENMGIPLAAQPNRPRENRAMSWGVAPVVARSPRISPITGANLKP